MRINLRHKTTKNTKGTKFFTLLFLRVLRAPFGYAQDRLRGKKLLYKIRAIHLRRDKMTYWVGAALAAIIAAKAAPTRDLSRLKRIAKIRNGESLSIFIICESVATVTGG